MKVDEMIKNVKWLNEKPTNAISIKEQKPSSIFCSLYKGGGIAAETSRDFQQVRIRKRMRLVICP